MKALILLFLIFSASTQAFTLNNNFAASFDKNRVKVKIEGSTVCDTLQMTIYELQDLIKPAVNDFWNRVPTSALRLTEGGFTDPIANMSHGRLCSPTDSSCISAAGGNLIPEVNDIVIACNDDGNNFSGSTSVLAVTIPNHFKSKKIKGAVILINKNATTAWLNLSRQDKIGVIAHEIGHAIGLGHTKEDEALMFDKVVDQRRTLGQDDIDGVSYLYPQKTPDGCGLFGGTIDTNRIDPQFWQMGMSFLMFLFVMKLLKAYLRTLKLVPRRPHSAS